MTSTAPPVLDRDIQQALKAVADGGCAPADPSKTTLTEARAQQDRYFEYINRDPAAMESIETIAINGDDGNLRLRVYRPPQGQEDYTVVFVRGAGWWAGGLDSHEKICRQIAFCTKQTVAAIDYRRSPEHVFPAQREDVLNAIRWLAARRTRLRGIGAGPFALWGESAGASLCVLAAEQLRTQANPEPPMALVLFYGNLGGPRESLRPQSRWVWQQYLGNAPSADLVAAATPMQARLDLLPPTWIGAGDADPLWADSAQFSQALQKQRVPQAFHSYPGMPHGFSVFYAESSVAAASINDAADFLRKQRSVHQPAAPATPP